MGDRHEQLACRERSCQRRVPVAEDEDRVRLLLQHRRLDRRQHVARLLAVGTGAGVEPVARRSQPELVEERCRELRVVVLPRVDDDLVESPVAEGEREGG